MDEYDIYIRGFTGARAADAERGLVRRFGLDARRARELVASLPRVVKRNVPAEHAAHYERVLQELGADYELRRSPIRPRQIIAVASSATGAAGDLEQHGSTLTLSLTAPAMRDADARDPAAAGFPQRASQFASTVVDPRLPFGLSQHASSMRGTLREGSPSLVQPARAGPEAPAATPVASPATGGATPGPQWPPPSAAPAAAGGGDCGDRIVDPAGAKVAPPTYGASAWASLEPHPRAAVPARPPAPAASSSSSSWRASAPSDPPPIDLRQASWDPLALELDGRPDWLVQGPQMYEEETPDMVAPADPAPSRAPEADGTRGVSVDPDDVWAQPFALPVEACDPALPPALQPNAAPPPEREADRPRVARPIAAGPARATLGATAQAPITHVGVYLGRELDDDSPPALLRFALRFGLGLSLFLILTTVRHCRVLDSDVQEALAAWGEQPAAEAAAPRPDARPADGPVTYGPRALPWLASDLHQVTSGDKDRARALVQRYKRAGASEVYMGNVMRSGMVQIAGELIIELPAGEAARKAVQAEHRRVRESVFGGFAPLGGDGDGPVLRMTL